MTVTIEQLWSVPTMTEGQTLEAAYDSKWGVVGEKPKVVLITGATGQIGRACALKLAQEDYGLVLTGRNEKVLDEVRYECKRRQVLIEGKIVSVAVDLRGPEGWSVLWEVVPPLYGLVHCAAVVGKGNLWERSPLSWTNEFRMNFEVPCRLCRGVSKILVSQGTGGRIVLLSSINAFYHNFGRSSYSAAKAAVDSLVRSLAIELGPYGVTVNSVRSGNLVKAMKDSPITEEGLESVRKRTPLLKLATPEDVANIVSFYLSKGAGHVTGTHLVCDGGFSIHAGGSLE